MARYPCGSRDVVAGGRPHAAPGPCPRRRAGRRPHDLPAPALVANLEDRYDPRRQVRDGGHRGRGHRRDRRHRPPATGSGWVGGLARRHFAVAVVVLASPSPSPSPSPSTAASVPSLPRLGLPGARASAAGDYGWEGGPGASAGMHKVGESGEVAVLVFAVDCLAGERPGAVPVRVAGLDGVSVEPYDRRLCYGKPARAPSRGPTRSRSAPGHCASS